MTATPTLSRSAALEAALRIDGWLRQGEAAALYDYARNATGPIIEIGSWQGRSTACLALGSMAGAGHDVYAVDSFEGVEPLDRATSLGVQPGRNSSSPEILRNNLNAAGVNGLVRIVAKRSAEAVYDVPTRCGLLFIDGSHDFENVMRDMELYLPKVEDNGVVVFHDALPTDPGVVAAIDKVLMTQADKWRPLGRFDSAVAFQKAPTIKHKVLLTCPGRGFAWGFVKATHNATQHHDVQLENNSNGFDDMNILWATAINKFEAGEITHFAMLHSDVAPQPLWLDVLLGEMDYLKADVVSTAIPIKDLRGLTSCGIGEHNNAWGAFRRWTMRELMELPPTFGIGDTPHPDKFLLHNTGCIVVDLRNPAIRAVDAEDCLKVWFDFPTRVGRHQGKFVHARESEDWFFSRKIAEQGLKTFITRKVSLVHLGETGFPNDQAWGSYMEGDIDTKPKWAGITTPAGAG